MLLTVAVLGLAIGSFLDVVASRLPHGGSLLRPASHCPTCQTVLRWRENVPVLSWLVLRGRCHTCGATIAARVVVIEALTAIAFGAVALVVGLSWSIPGLCLLVATALAVAAAAADDAALPPGVVLVGTAAGAAALVAATAADGSWGQVAGAVTGGVAGVAVLAAARTWSRRRERSGHGRAARQAPGTTVPSRDRPLGAVDTVEMLLPVGTLIGWLGATAALGALAGATVVAAGTAMVAARRHNRPPPAPEAISSTPPGSPSTRRTRRLVIAVAGIAAIAGALSARAASGTATPPPRRALSATVASSTTRSGLVGTRRAPPWPGLEETAQDATGTNAARPVCTTPRRSSMTFRSWGFEAAAMASRRSMTCCSSSCTSAWSNVSMP